MQSLTVGQETGDTVPEIIILLTWAQEHRDRGKIENKTIWVEWTGAVPRCRQEKEEKVSTDKVKQYEFSIRR